MKCAEANTRLSFVTATLNCLWAATPPSFQQYHVNGRAGQVRRGAGVQGVGLVPELTIERGDGIPSRHRPDPSDIEHRAGAALYPHCRIDTELAGDVRVGRDRKSTRLNSSHSQISYADFCLKKESGHRVPIGIGSFDCAARTAVALTSKP